MMSHFFKTMFFFALLSLACAQDQPECRKFSEIYSSGKQLCENMWDNAFKYEEDEANAYTMWFFDKENPNDKTTERLASQGLFEQEGPVDQCYLAYYHKGNEEHIDNVMHPSEEPDSFKECHPWAENSCCFQDTVSTVEKIKESYGENYEWDRCGKLSQACERFFVMEACFYECEPNAGIFRQHKDSADHPDPFGGTHELHTDPNCETTNGWQLRDMPIKASFCDSWYQACMDDYFCAENDGSYFSCAKAWEPFDIIEEENRLPGSCKGSCGGASKDGPCMCDEECESSDPITCCADREEVCKPVWIPRAYGSCEGACGVKSKDGTCYCDSSCEDKGDCCDDIADQCLEQAVGSCAGICGGKIKNTGGSLCYCDSACVNQSPPDCCEDKEEFCPISGGNQ